jgi:hypothetical protein
VTPTASPHRLAAGHPPAARDALRETTAVAVRLASSDSVVREQAWREADELQERIAAAPRPSDVLLSRVAADLRDAAERLDRVARPEGRQQVHSGQECTPDGVVAPDSVVTVAVEVQRERRW